jgi:hypothetical protein
MADEAPPTTQGPKKPPSSSAPTRPTPKSYPGFEMSEHREHHYVPLPSLGAPRSSELLLRHAVPWRSFLAAIVVGVAVALTAHDPKIAALAVAITVVLAVAFAAVVAWIRRH